MYFTRVTKNENSFYEYVETEDCLYYFSDSYTNKLSPASIYNIGEVKKHVYQQKNTKATHTVIEVRTFE